MPEGPLQRSAAEKKGVKDERADRIDDLKARLQLANERNEDLKVKWKAASHARIQLQDEYDAVRRSYHLSGVGKKIDISTLPDFGALARQVMEEGRVGMHFDRLYTLWQAVQRAPRGLPVVEVGSYKGGSSKFIAEALRRAGQSPRFYVCDTFSGHARLDPAIDGVQSDEGFRDTSADSVRAYLADYPNVELVVGDIVETSARLTEPAYGFVHVDVDVYPPTTFCLDFFSTRLAPGAWMVVDDYGVVTCPGAQRAVDEFVRGHTSFSKLHLLTGQAVVFRAG
jgi:predicted O-methyltransferase YrrM